MTERTIGQLAHDANVCIETIRYYQRNGLIPKPQRTFNGWRRYPERTLQLATRPADLRWRTCAALVRGGGTGFAP